MKGSNDSITKRIPRPFLTKVVVGIIVVLALIHIPSVLMYMAASSALDHMNTRIVKEAGGVAINKPQVVHGGIWWFQNLCIDTPCPTIQQDFLVPLEPGKEEGFMSQDLLASQGFKPLPSTGCHLDSPGALCLESGSKPGSKVFMTLDPVAKQSGLIPDQSISPKVWRTLSIQSYP